MKGKIVSPRNFGWLEHRLDTRSIDYLWEIIKVAKIDNKLNLVGNISKSLNLNDNNNYFFDNILVNLIKAYNQNFGIHFLHQGLQHQNKLGLEGFWVNYQYKNEFNPFHSHTGIYSFAIWLKIPTEWEEQADLSFLVGVEKDLRKVSCFEFQYTDTLGQIQSHTYKLNKSYEGTILFFPAGLQHAVHPFYESNEPRISVAGNISILK
jgi:hypothetical protein